MKTSYDRGKSCKSQTVKANEMSPSCCSRNGNPHEKQTTQSTSGWVQPRNHGENAMPSWAENILPGWRESQMSDVCNGNVPLGQTSEKACHQVTSVNSNKERVLKKVSATQKVRDEPKDSPSKAAFMFWANKVNTSSKMTTFQKLPQKPSVTTRSCSPALLPGEGLSSLEEKVAKNPQRKTRRDLFSDSNVFSHVDSHILHVTQQLRSGHVGLSIQAIIPLITAKSRSKLETVRAIWFWLCHNIEYDVDGFLGLSQKIHRPEQVLQTGRAVCSGYAHLCQEMCREAGLSCVEIPGFGRSPGTRGGRWCQQQKSSHMWNVVELEGQWHLLDAPGSVDAENRLFMPRHDDFFFLTDPEHFVETHWPEDPQWQLLQPPVLREVFEQRGSHRLSMFVKDLGGSSFRNVANFLIRCLRPIHQNELFPSGLSTHCGSGISSSSYGLSNPSHSSPIITTQLGKCNITFHAPADFEVTASLSKDKVIGAKYPLERYGLVTHLRTKVSVCVVLPESGIYKVGLLGRRKDREDFTHICDYVIRCFSDPCWLPFPRGYSLWRRGCVLLREQSWVRFRVKVPKAYGAVVLGQEKTVLQQPPNAVWEGDVFTGAVGTQVKLEAKFSQSCSSLEVILAFEVEGGSPTSLGCLG